MVLHQGATIPRRSDVDRWLKLLCLAILLLSLGLPSNQTQAAEAYRLGPEDKVRLKVFEWRPSQDQVFEWKALNDEFTVGASGMLSVPLAGDLHVAGQTPADVAKMVASRLQQRMGLAEPPDASIDVIQYRPFFVAGDVIHPGPYPYHPGLTVLEAVATSGGTLRTMDRGLDRFDREVITGEGDIQQTSHEIDALLIRRSRLQAEVDGSDATTLPPELVKRKAQPDVIRMLQAETQIFVSRQSAFKAQTDALKELKQFLAKETQSLDAQLATIDTQMGLINKELTGVSSLVEKGMAIAPRQMALERSVAQITGDRLSMQTNKLRVLEEISKADIAIIQLRNSRATDASVELRDTQLKFDDLASKLATTDKLLYESKVSAPGMLAYRLHREAVQPRYTIVRPQNGSGEIEVSETTEIQPGDTVKVLLPVPNDLMENASNPSTPIQ